MKPLFEVTVSYGQQRLWTLDRLESGSASYHMPFGLRLTGKLNVPALVCALHFIVERHESLRTVLKETAEGILNAVVMSAPEADSLLDIKDLSGLTTEQATQQSQESAQAIVRLPFNLSEDIPLRAQLHIISPSESFLVIVMHHHASDGVSTGIFIRELEEAYKAFKDGASPTWPELPVQYSDWATWQQSIVETNLDEKISSAHLRLLDAPDELTLPLDRTRLMNRARRAEHLRVELEPQTVSLLQALARQTHTTLFNVVLAIYGATLGRIAGQ